MEGGGGGRGGGGGGWLVMFMHTTYVSYIAILIVHFKKKSDSIREIRAPKHIPIPNFRQVN